MKSEVLLTLISTPLYAIVIGMEMLLSHLHNRHLYAQKDTLTNVYLTVLNVGLDGLSRFFTLGVLLWIYQFRVMTPTHNWIYWALLVIGVDFFYYWLHRTDHYCRLFWAVHVTHHSSEYFNLTTGFRSSVFEPLYRFVFYLPLPLLGFDVLDLFFMHSLLQTYGIIVHTQLVGKLPAIVEYFLVTPSHHRVHHGSNVKYLDKNMGMTFIIWDRLFGTFQEEDPGDPVVYGLMKNPTDRGPVNIVFHEWRSILKDLRQPLPLGIRLKYLLMPPGWSHDGRSKTSDQLRRELEQREQAV